MKSKRRLMALFAAVAMVLGLAACSGKDEGGGKAGQMVYVAQDMPFSSKLNTIDGACVSGGSVYLLGQEKTGGSYVVVRLAPEGGEAETLPDYQTAQPAGRGAFAISAAIRPGAEDTLWVTERMLVQTYSEETKQYGQADTFFLRQLDSDGKELAQASFVGLEDKLKLGRVTELLTDGNGTVYAISEEGIAALDENGDAVFSLELKQQLSYGAMAAVLKDGRIGVGCVIKDDKGNDVPALRTIDGEAKSWGECFVLPSGDIGGVYDGDSEALFYYRIGGTVCAWRDGGKEGEQILNLVDLGIDCSRFHCVSALQDGKVALMTGSDWNSAGGVSLNILTLTDVSQIQDRKVLTYATLFMTSNQQRAIIDFNKTNPDYRIAVTDYSQYGDTDAARTRLITEIGAGRMPDLLDTFGIPVEKWAGKGYLEDLWPWIDGDPDLGREALMDRVFQAAEIDGKLYDISRSFWIWTVTGAKSVVGDRMTWTGEDMWKALEAMPEGCAPAHIDRMELLRRLIELDRSRFVDQIAGTCDFDNDAFRSILSFCADYPAERVTGGMEQAVYEKRVMLITSAISGFTFPQMAKSLLRDEISYVGYPNDQGDVGSQFGFVSGIAMSSACGDKAGAWSFLRSFLLPLPDGELENPQNTYTAFPVNKADFHRAVELAMTPAYEENEKGEKIETWKTMMAVDGAEEDIYLYALTQAEYDQLMELYDAVDTFARWDPDLTSVIASQAAPYFAGDATLEETAAAIQSRVKLYVNEQR